MNHLPRRTISDESAAANTGLDTKCCILPIGARFELCSFRDRARDLRPVFTLRGDMLQRRDHEFRPINGAVWSQGNYRTIKGPEVTIMIGEWMVIDPADGVPA